MRCSSIRAEMSKQASRHARPQVVNKKSNKLIRKQKLWKASFKIWAMKVDQSSFRGALVSLESLFHVATMYQSPSIHLPIMILLRSLNRNSFAHKMHENKQKSDDQEYKSSRPRHFAYMRAKINESIPYPTPEAVAWSIMKMTRVLRRAHFAFRLLLFFLFSLAHCYLFVISFVPRVTRSCYSMPNKCIAVACCSLLDANNTFPHTRILLPTWNETGRTAQLNWKSLRGIQLRGISAILQGSYYNILGIVYTQRFWCLWNVIIYQVLHLFRSEVGDM